MDGSVGQDQARDLDRVDGGRGAFQPAQRHGAAPVVGDHHDVAGELEAVGERREVVDPLGEASLDPVR